MTPVKGPFFILIVPMTMALNDHHSVVAAMIAAICQIRDGVMRDHAQRHSCVSFSDEAQYALTRDEAVCQRARRLLAR